MTEQDRRVSDQLVRLIQVIFGIVLAQSLVRYDTVILAPFSRNHFLAFCGLITVFTATILSWIDWHITMEKRPYNLGPGEPLSIYHKLRVFSDVLVVTIYAYVLFAIKDFSDDSSGDISDFILGFMFIFVGYLISGTLRRKVYGRLASTIWLINLFVIIFLAYYFLYAYLVIIGRINIPTLNAGAIALLFATMVFYRFSRTRIKDKKSKRKKAGLRIGIDVDGVIADQITGVIPRIKRRLGISLRYQEVVHWKMPLGQSSIDKEIVFAMEDSNYISSMLMHPFARAIIDDLYEENNISIITARPAHTESWTRLWLTKQGISFDNLYSVQENEKSLYALDMLIDDYIGNILEFLDKTTGYAILINQPWNQDRGGLTDFFEKQRLWVVSSLSEVPAIVELVKNRRDS